MNCLLYNYYFRKIYNAVRGKSMLFLMTIILFFSCNGLDNSSMNDLREKRYVMSKEQAVEVAKDFYSRTFPHTKTVGKDLNVETRLINRKIALESGDVRSIDVFEDVPLYVITFTDDSNTPKGYVVEVGDSRLKIKF